MFKNYLISLTLLTSTVSLAKPDEAVGVDMAKPTLNILSENGKARFQITQEEGCKPITIHPAFVDTSLRSVDRDSLLTMMDRGDGYLRLTRNDHGEYGIGLRVRGNGGGLVLGNILYWGTKSVLYGALVAGVAIPAATGIGAAVGAGAAAVGASAATASAAATTATAATGLATKATIVSLGASSAGTTLVAAAVTGAGLAPVAGEIATATVAAGGLTGLVGAIEAASLFMGALGGLAPTP